MVEWTRLNRNDSRILFYSVVRTLRHPVAYFSLNVLFSVDCRRWTHQQFDLFTFHIASVKWKRTLLLDCEPSLSALHANVDYLRIIIIRRCNTRQTMNGINLLRRSVCIDQSPIKPYTFVNQTRILLVPLLLFLFLSLFVATCHFLSYHNSHAFL